MQPWPALHRGAHCRAAEALRARYEHLAWKLHHLERGIAHADRSITARGVPAADDA